ncbi:MAG: hypothetical protein CVU11_01120 [Bacteroidetes bacterium HGW-Bacteroidetes-6]|nr:MAG: hypothetical protein CVU11_01120 [Bacteroidetes bacterium HGW-Bacteroidetes-6]
MLKNEDNKSEVPEKIILFFYNSINVFYRFRDNRIILLYEMQQKNKGEAILSQKSNSESRFFSDWLQ